MRLQCSIVSAVLPFLRKPAVSMSTKARPFPMRTSTESRSCRASLTMTRSSPAMIHERGLADVAAADQGDVHSVRRGTSSAVRQELTARSSSAETPMLERGNEEGLAVAEAEEPASYRACRYRPCWRLYAASRSRAAVGDLAIGGGMPSRMSTKRMMSAGAGRWRPSFGRPVHRRRGLSMMPPVSTSSKKQPPLGDQADAVSVVPGVGSTIEMRRRATALSRWICRRSGDDRDDGRRMKFGSWEVGKNGGTGGLRFEV